MHRNRADIERVQSAKPTNVGPNQKLAPNGAIVGSGDALDSCKLRPLSTRVTGEEDVVLSIFVSLIDMLNARTN